jgi:hypothetical protein
VLLEGSGERYQALGQYPERSQKIFWLGIGWGDFPKESPIAHPDERSVWIGILGGAIFDFD